MTCALSISCVGVHDIRPPFVFFLSAGQVSFIYLFFFQKRKILPNFRFFLAKNITIDQNLRSSFESHLTMWNGNLEKCQPLKKSLIALNIFYFTQKRRNKKKKFFYDHFEFMTQKTFDVRKLVLKNSICKLNVIEWRRIWRA